MNKEVYIIGGGPSLTNFDFKKLKNKDVIVVNKAILDYPEANYFITMDYTFLEKISKTLFKKTPLTKIFIVSLFGDQLKEANGQIIDTVTEKVYNLKEYTMIIKSRLQEGMGLSFGTFVNGANSGYCALQFAVIMGYTEINLLGYDMTFKKKTHYHGGYEEQDSDKLRKKLNRDVKRFKTGIKQLKTIAPEVNVYSCSNTSKLNNILNKKNWEKI